MSRKKTIEEFIKDGQLLFGRKYDYSKVVYINAHTEIEISCRKHGPLKNMTPNRHLRRDGGCKKCQEEKAQKKLVMHIDVFVNKAIEINGDAYDYSLVHQFKNHHEKIKIICRDCKKVFKQNPNKHLNGHGCNNKTCVNKRIGDNQRMSKDEFMIKAIEVHGPERYSYKNSIYNGVKEKIDIFCNICSNEFPQTPDAHINLASGCPKCGEEIRILGDTVRNLKKKNIFIEGNLYVIECYSDKESFFKIGVSGKKTHQRYSGTKLPYDYEMIAELPIGLIEAYLQERYILEQYERYSYEPDKYFRGHTECLSVNPIEIDERLKEIYNKYLD